MSVITSRSVNMGALEKPLVRCTVSSKFDIARLERAVRADPASLPSIQVGIVNGKCYPMGKLDVLAACQAAGAREIRADVKDYDSKLDLMTDQIKEVSAAEYIDPLHTRDAINEFGRCGIKADDMLEMAGIVGTSIAKIAMSGITNEALQVLDDFMNTELSEKLPAACLVVPTHILLKIARLESRNADNHRNQGDQAHVSAGRNEFYLADAACNGVRDQEHPEAGEKRRGRDSKADQDGG